jgi:hypothetical protein
MAAAAVQQAMDLPQGLPIESEDDALARRDTRQRIYDLEAIAKSPEIAWVKKQMQLIRAEWSWSTSHAQIAWGFLQSTTNGRLFAYRDEAARLHVLTNFPQKQRWDEVRLFALSSIYFTLDVM